MAEKLAPARFAPYLAAAHGDVARAEALYRWNSKLAGAWHVHLGYVEVCMRQAMDRQLQLWNSSQVVAGRRLRKDWTAPHMAAPLLHDLIGQGIAKARASAQEDSRRRPPNHPRRRAAPTHDDAVAQLMFGAWSRLLLLPGAAHPRADQLLLWRECLSGAFPGVPNTSKGLHQVGHQVEGLRRLRNRVAHNENLLAVDSVARLNGSLTLLRAIDDALPEIVMRDSQLRTVSRQDPRLPR